MHRKTQRALLSDDYHTPIPMSFCLINHSNIIAQLQTTKIMREALKDSKTREKQAIPKERTRGVAEVYKSKNDAYIL